MTLTDEELLAKARGEKPRLSRTAVPGLRALIKEFNLAQVIDGLNLVARARTSQFDSLLANVPRRNIPEEGLRRLIRRTSFQDVVDGLHLILADERSRQFRERPR